MLNVISTCRDIFCVDLNVNRNVDKNVNKRCVDHSTSHTTKRILCVVDSAMTTPIIPHYIWGIIGGLGCETHGMWASLSCFLWCQFVKIGFRMKVHWFMTTKLLLCVTYNLHKFKIQMIESNKYYEMICMRWFVFMLYMKNKVTSCVYIELICINAK